VERLVGAAGKSERPFDLDPDIVRRRIKSYLRYTARVPEEYDPDFVFRINGENDVETVYAEMVSLIARKSPVEEIESEKESPEST